MHDSLWVKPIFDFRENNDNFLVDIFILGVATSKSHLHLHTLVVLSSNSYKRCQKN